MESPYSWFMHGMASRWAITAIHNREAASMLWMDDFASPLQRIGIEERLTRGRCHCCQLLRTG
jgi:hypothetical protein